MWKNLIISSAILFYGINIYAQYQQLRRFHIGVETGPNLSILYGNSDRPYHYYPAVGFSGGVSFSAILMKHLSVRSSLSYDRKIEKIKEDVLYSNETMPTWVTGRGHSYFDYLTIPLLVQFDVGKTVNFFCNLGPYLGFLMNCKGIVETPSDEVYKFTPKANHFDFGIASGIGIIVRIKDNYTVKFETRNKLGLLPLYQKFKELKINSVDFLFGFAYGIP